MYYPLLSNYNSTCGQVTSGVVWDSPWSLSVSVSKNRKIESFAQGLILWPIEKCQIYSTFDFLPIKVRYKAGCGVGSIEDKKNILVALSPGCQQLIILSNTPLPESKGLRITIIRILNVTFLVKVWFGDNWCLSNEITCLKLNVAVTQVHTEGNHTVWRGRDSTRRFSCSLLFSLPNTSYKPSGSSPLLLL